MARALRLECASAIYYVTSRGARHEGIHLNEADRIACLAVLTTVCYLTVSRAGKEHGQP